MSKAKSVFVTALVAVMLAAIAVGLYLLKYRAYLVIVGLASIYGYLCASCSFCRWLEKEPPLLLPLPAKSGAHIKGEEVPGELWQPDTENYYEKYMDWTRRTEKLREEAVQEEPQQVESNPEIMGYEK